MGKEKEVVQVGAKEAKLEFGVDANKDGEQSVKGALHLNEAIQEAFRRKESIVIENAKIVSFEVRLTKLVLKVDTDRDGEPLLEIEADLPEVIDETGLMS